jgi:hypothetical protein
MLQVKINLILVSYIIKMTENWKVNKLEKEIKRTNAGNNK